jgi:hypothetical protein
VDPVAAYAASIDVAGRSSHTTPVVSVGIGDAWVVSYWTHKDSTATLLTPPAGVVVRASGTHPSGLTNEGRRSVLPEATRAEADPC